MVKKLEIRPVNEGDVVPGAKELMLRLLITSEGNEVDGVTLFVEGNSPGGVAEGENNIYFEEVKPGSITIKAKKEGYEDGELTIPVPEPPEPGPKEPEKPGPEKPSEEEVPKLPDTPIADALFFSGQEPYSADIDHLEAIKAEIDSLVPVSEIKGPAAELAKLKLLKIRKYQEMVERRLKKEAATNALLQDVLDKLSKHKGGIVLVAIIALTALVLATGVGAFFLGPYIPAA